MDSWTFPFKTCEAPSSSGIVAQPYSFAINAISTLILSGYAYFSPIPQVRWAISSYAVFEAYHAFSHAVRVDAHVQTLFVHLLSYVFLFATYGALHTLSHRELNHAQVVILMVLAIVDIGVYACLGGLWPVLTGLTLFFSLFVFYYPWLPRTFQHRLCYVLIPGLLVLFGLFVNEAYHCERMLARYPRFPFHAVIEILGLLLFVVLADSLYHWKYRAP